MGDKQPKRIRTDEYKCKKKGYDKARGKTRVNLGAAFQRWRDLRERKGLKTDEEVALFLLDSESVHYEYPLMMSSPNEDEQETCAAPSVKSSENGKEPGKKVAACQRPKSQDEWTTSKQSENKENRDIQEDEDEEFCTSLSVGDGRYLVDLGSSSEFIVDEECILQLFRSCRECNRKCTVRKYTEGLKLVVNQACSFCPSRCKWTNLPDEKDDADSGFQINGKDTAYGQTNTAMSLSSNTS
ncbi:uncharacterized protein LOC108875766 isoform X3 [Lates calcarifer]|uniref:Uncharacterized protein LOC108875766 isoform X3 n=1 Tax=Lates calcarifer TaxID=8187 RepID=A0AAJ7PEA7_LATCA|nr:uncharacterized protein LOC108875766 isoform X3 [Lates calcarifer]XP_018520405.1 uncharacterized protein LOC108875766 isoform X3 [Lates calcarifer]XP_018520406.1 uncharacterized protein LOC108875766 isoform X3 [Lates calcarifer]XP_018520409.1 uncharacterized protein LOC108875766 isoform X3 [Lates calcarifer]XP_050926668.1 uncharacterized protein LOC108875766 isoform X3 [Lates calcarifer]XP_050926669.1 uncharacterized protein LOC108875766 isoform X3 [Lates calcarifer]